MSETYKAIEVRKPGEFAEVRRPLQDPGHDQVRIRIEACGVCHSDAATVEGSFPGITYPRVPGHEVVGRIDAVGPGVRGWQVGQRVGVGFLAGSCGYCEFCRGGDLVNCQNQENTGIHHDGGYAEVLLAKASGLMSIPDDLSAVDAAKLKWWTAQVQNDVLDHCVQLYGGYGYMNEYRVARAWRDARFTKIWAGTNEIMKEIIGRDLGL